MDIVAKDDIKEDAGFSVIDFEEFTRRKII